MHSKFTTCYDEGIGSRSHTRKRAPRPDLVPRIRASDSPSALPWLTSVGSAKRLELQTTDDAPEKHIMSITYSEEEKILAQHGVGIYEAKVRLSTVLSSRALAVSLSSHPDVNLQILKVESKSAAPGQPPKPHYFIHYQGWKDRCVPCWFVAVA